ncbi:MAG: hypothetical protein QXO32_00450 [Candidatus Bathyarchaeia archaeon]
MSRKSAANLILYMLAFTAIQLYFTRYVEASPLQTTFTTPYFKHSIPLIWLVSGATILQAAASWSYSIRGSLMGKWRTATRPSYKAAAFSSLLLFLYAGSLFGLFILSSPLPVRVAAYLASIEPSFKASAENIVQLIQPFIQWPVIVKYAVAQFAASTMLLIGSLAPRPGKRG